MIVLINIKDTVDGKSGGEKIFVQTKKKNLKQAAQKTYTMSNPSTSQKKVETTKLYNHI